MLTSLGVIANEEKTAQNSSDDLVLMLNLYQMQPGLQIIQVKLWKIEKFAFSTSIPKT